MHLQMLKPWTEFKSMWFECNVTLARFYEEKTLFYSKSNCVQLRYIRCCASPKNRHKPSTDYQTRSSGSWIVIRTMQLWRVAHTASVASLARLSSMVMMIHACARPYLLQYSAGILGAWCKKHPHQWTNEQRAYAFYPICTWLTVTKIIMCGHGFGGRLICYTVPVLGHSNSVGHYHLLRVGFFFLFADNPFSNALRRATSSNSLLHRTMISSASTIVPKCTNARWLSSLAVAVDDNCDNVTAQNAVFNAQHRQNIDNNINCGHNHHVDEPKMHAYAAPAHR